MRPSHHHHDKTWFVIPHVIPDYFGAGIFEFLGFYMNMWEIFFQYCFLQLFKSQTLSSELSSTFSLKCNLLPFLTCYFSRDLCHTEAWKCLSSKIYFPKWPKTAARFPRIFFFPILLYCPHISSLHFIFAWASGRVIKTTLEFGAISSSSYKKNPPSFCEQTSLWYLQVISFTIFLRALLINHFMLTVGQPKTTLSI